MKQQIEIYIIFIRLNLGQLYKIIKDYHKRKKFYIILEDLENRNFILLIKYYISSDILVILNMIILNRNYSENFFL